FCSARSGSRHGWLGRTTSRWWRSSDLRRWGFMGWYLDIAPKARASAMLTLRSRESAAGQMTNLDCFTVEAGESKFGHEEVAARTVEGFLTLISVEHSIS